MKLTLISLSALLGASAYKLKENATPVEKVIELISDLKENSESELKAEQDVYDKYSCFCKDNTDDKSKAITDSQVLIDDLAASIVEGTGTRDKLAAEIADLQKEIAKLDKEMKEEKASHLKDRTHREAVIADLEKAVYSLEGAISAVKDSKPAALVSVKATIRHNLMVAEALGMASAKRATTAFLQSSQEPDYEFHSDGILETLNDLNEDFSKRLSDDQADLARAIKAHEDLMTEKTNARDAADKSEKSKSEQKAETIKKLGEDKTAITEERQSLSLSQLYLKDLTAQCELKAREFDQRNGMRKSEIAALDKALDILKNRVQKNEGARTFLNQNRAKVTVAATRSDYSDDDISFVQTKIAKMVRSNSRNGRALAQLKSRANKLHSFQLLEAAQKISTAGPFDKVKKLIAKLIERLLTEAKEEATQKGWCDTETAKATKERDYKFEAITKLNAELEANEATKAEAEAAVERLTEEIDTTEKDQAAADEARKEENENNTKTLKDAREGLEALEEALKVLKDFYHGEHGVGGANTATVSFAQTGASPIAVDEPESFDGAYQGNQDAASGILGLLNVIRSDFMRTIEKTSESEKEAAAAHVKFTRKSKTFLAGANTEKKNKEHVVKTMTHAIASGMEDLKTNQGMMDAAVKTLEDLQQPCVDTGMSYEERKKKREDEMEALKTALCQLDPEKKEAECM